MEPTKTEFNIIVLNATINVYPAWITVKIAWNVEVIGKVYQHVDAQTVSMMITYQNFVNHAVFLVIPVIFSGV